MLRTFFQFCIEREWITKNPAENIKAPHLKVIPRIPFSEKEIQNILSKAEDDRQLAFSYSYLDTPGLRIGDASLLKQSHLAGRTIFTYIRPKQGRPVSILLPENLVSLLKKLPPKRPILFLRGESTHPHTASDLWRKRIKAICKRSGYYGLIIRTGSDTRSRPICFQREFQ